MDKSRKFLYLMSAAMNRIKYHSIQKFQEEGITVSPSQMGILFLLKKGEPLTMSTLSAALSVDNSTLTRHADRLIKSGLIERIKDDSDRRVLKLRITPAGLKESEKAAKISNRINSEILAGLSEKDIETFSRILLNIIDKF